MTMDCTSVFGGIGRAGIVSLHRPEEDSSNQWASAPAGNKQGLWAGAAKAKGQAEKPQNHIPHAYPPFLYVESTDSPLPPGGQSQPELPQH